MVTPWHNMPMHTINAEVQDFRYEQTLNHGCFRKVILISESPFIRINMHHDYRYVLT